MESTISEVESDNAPLVVQSIVSDSRSPRTTRTSSSSSMIPVILVVMLERLTYYSVIANLLLFLKYDVFREKQGSKSSSDSASKSVLVLIGFSWLMCVAGGWLSDARFGKLKTLIIGLVFYVIGMGLLFGAAFIFMEYPNYIKQPIYRALLVFPCFITCLIGEGAYKANISPFGAEQLSRQDETSTRRFFNYYYCSLNFGAFCAYVFVAYLQQKYGFVVGFAIPFGTIFLAFLILTCNRSRYKSVPSQHILGKVWKIIYNARMNRKRNRSSSPQITLYATKSWLDYAKLKHGGSFLEWEVEDVKQFLHVIPVFIVLIPYWAIYTQMQATFLEQGTHMNIYDNSSFSVPAAWLNIINVTVVMALIPFMEKIVYPYLTKHGYRNSPITRITFGILIACLSIIAASFVEIYVCQDLKDGKVKNQVIDRQNTTATEISVFWQIPQYMLIGVSEVFAVVAGLEFAYINAPKSMQSIVMALYFVTHSLGSLLGYLLLELSEHLEIIPDQRHQNHSNHTYYYYLLCCLTLVSWFVFIIYINHSKYGENKNNHLKRLLSTRIFGDASINEENIDNSRRSPVRR